MPVNLWKSTNCIVGHWEPTDPSGHLCSTSVPFLHTRASSLPSPSTSQRRRPHRHSALDGPQRASVPLLSLASPIREGRGREENIWRILHYIILRHSRDLRWRSFISPVVFLTNHIHPSIHSVIPIFIRLFVHSRQKGKKEIKKSRPPSTRCAFRAIGSAALRIISIFLPTGFEVFTFFFGLLSATPTRV